MNYEAAKIYILSRLQAELSPHLTYHCLAHTLDVLDVATQLGQTEKHNAHHLALLQTAAVLHDTGFLQTYFEHEAESCRFARRILPHFGYADADIARICQLIMATRIPQTPNGDPLAQILCDADLDYLGRDDFEPIAETLFQELTTFRQVDNRVLWNQIQIRFLNAHQYFTLWSQQTRTPRKIQHLEQLLRSTSIARN